MAIPKNLNDYQEKLKQKAIKEQERNKKHKEYVSDYLNRNREEIYKKNNERAKIQREFYKEWAEKVPKMVEKLKELEIDIDTL